MSQPDQLQLSDLCELLHISVHRPRLVFRINNAKVFVDDLEIDDDKTTKASWKLMPADMDSAFNRIRTQLNKLTKRYTVGFRAMNLDTQSYHDGYRIDGVFLVPFSGIEALLESVKELNRELIDVVHEWATDNKLTDHIRASTKPEIFELLKDKIPTTKQLLSRTRIDVVSIPFGENKRTLTGVAGRDLLKQAREKTAELVEQVTLNLFSEPRRELADALVHLSDLVQATRRLTSRSLQPIRAAIDKLRIFDFVADETFLQRLDDLLLGLGGAVGADFDDLAATNIVTAIQTITNDALDIAQIQRQMGSVRAQRRLTLLPVQDRDTDES